jgi:hypothetical protein
MTASAGSLQTFRDVGRAGFLVPVLVGVTMVTGLINSLGVPLIPVVASTLYVPSTALSGREALPCSHPQSRRPIMGHGCGSRCGRETMVIGFAIVFAAHHSRARRLANRARRWSCDAGGVGLGPAPVTMADAGDQLPADRAPSVIGLLSVVRSSTALAIRGAASGSPRRGSSRRSGR